MHNLFKHKWVLFSAQFVCQNVCTVVYGLRCTLYILCGRLFLFLYRVFCSSVNFSIHSFPHFFFFVSVSFFVDEAFSTHLRFKLTVLENMKKKKHTTTTHSFLPCTRAHSLTHSYTNMVHTWFPSVSTNIAYNSNCDAECVEDETATAYSIWEWCCVRMLR